MSDGRYILNDQHEPIPASQEACSRLLANIAKRRVAETVIADSKVSTVFLVYDHGIREDEPELFETMVFGGLLDGETERYSTWTEAELGHAKMIGRVKAASEESR